MRTPQAELANLSAALADKADRVDANNAAVEAKRAMDAANVARADLEAFAETATAVQVGGRERECARHARAVRACRTPY